MRFDFEALRQHVAAKAALSVPALVAAGGVALAMLAVLYGVMRGADDVPADAVVVNGPVFTPVALTPPAPEPAVRPTTPGSASAMRFDDAVSVTRAVQTELKRAGCYQGPVNGVWSVPTRKAMAEFTTLVNARLPVDRPDSVLLVLLETHNTTSCSDGASAGAEEKRRGRERRTETASIEQRRSDEQRDVTRAPVETEASIPKFRSEDRGYSVEERQPSDAASSVETAVVEPEPGSDTLGTGEAAALAAAGTAAATTHYKASPPERRRTSRRYKKQPSLARSVSKGFRQIQRSLNKLF